MTESLVELDNLTFKRGDRKIFDQLSLQIPAGKITAIMGPSGTGKTTLLHLISGSLLPDVGQVTVFNQRVEQLSQRELYQLRVKMGFVFQAGALFTDLSVYENIAFAYRNHTSLPEDMIHDLVMLKLEAVGLRGAAGLEINELSGGMARRVAIARALAMDPELMLYDEPLTGQDPITRAVLFKLIRELNDALGLTSIIVTHSLEVVQKLADNVVILSQGKVIGSGDSQSIMTNDNPAIKQFVHALPDGVVPFHYPAKQTLLEELSLC